MEILLNVKEDCTTTVKRRKIGKVVE